MSVGEATCMDLCTYKHSRVYLHPFMENYRSGSVETCQFTVRFTEQWDRADVHDCINWKNVFSSSCDNNNTKSHLNTVINGPQTFDFAVSDINFLPMFDMIPILTKHLIFDSDIHWYWYSGAVVTWFCLLTKVKGQRSVFLIIFCPLQAFI